MCGFVQTNASIVKRENSCFACIIVNGLICSRHVLMSTHMHTHAHTHAPGIHLQDGHLLSLHVILVTQLHLPPKLRRIRDFAGNQRLHDVAVVDVHGDEGAQRLHEQGNQRVLK